MRKLSEEVNTVQAQSGHNLDTVQAVTTVTRLQHQLPVQERRRLTTGQGDYWMAYEDFAR